MVRRDDGTFGIELAHRSEHGAAKRSRDAAVRGFVTAIPAKPRSAGEITPIGSPDRRNDGEIVWWRGVPARWRELLTGAPACRDSHHGRTRSPHHPESMPTSPASRRNHAVEPSFGALPAGIASGGPARGSPRWTISPEDGVVRE